MTVDPNELLGLSPAEQLRLVELLWDNLGKSTDPIPLPDWVEAEALRRRNELVVDPEIGLNHEAVWSKIDRRHALNASGYICGDSTAKLFQRFAVIRARS